MKTEAIPATSTADITSEPVRHANTVLPNSETLPPPPSTSSVREASSHPPRTHLSQQHVSFKTEEPEEQPSLPYEPSHTSQPKTPSLKTEHQQEPSDDQTKIQSPKLIKPEVPGHRFKHKRTRPPSNFQIGHLPPTRPTKPNRKKRHPKKPPVKAEILPEPTFTHSASSQAR